MRIKLFFLILGVMILSSIKIYCQGKLKTDTSVSKVIKIDSLFKCYGVIFGNKYIAPIEIQNVRERVTPTEEDVITAEQIFITQYNAVNQASEGRKGTKLLDDPKKYFAKFNRQYIGYIDNDGDLNLIIHLFDFSKKRKVKKYIGDSWTNKFVIVLAESLPFDIVTYRVNITQKKLYTTF